MLVSLKFPFNCLLRTKNNSYSSFKWYANAAVWNFLEYLCIWSMLIQDIDLRCMRRSTEPMNSDNRAKVTMWFVYCYFNHMYNVKCVLQVRALLFLYRVVSLGGAQFIIITKYKRNWSKHQYNACTGCNTSCNIIISFSSGCPFVTGQALFASCV